MGVINEMLEKIERGEKDIPSCLNDYFSGYKKDLKKFNPEKIKAGNFRYRVDKFSSHFKKFLEDNKWDVYPEVNLNEPNELPKYIFKNQETCSLLKTEYPRELNHIYKRMKKIDFIARRKHDKRVLFIETKITPDIAKFFDALLEFSMIDTNALNNNHSKHFIILSDYGGNPFTPTKTHGQKDRPIELDNEFKFIKDLFKTNGLFTEENVHFILLDPEHLSLEELDTIDKINKILLIKPSY